MAVPVALRPALLGLLALTFGLVACDGSSSPHRSDPPPAPVAVSPCPASVVVPTDSTHVVPAAAVPPTAVIRTGGALSVDVPAGSTVGFGAPVRQGAGSILCRAAGSSAGVVVLLGREPGFVRVVVAVPSGAQRAVNVQVTV